MAKGIMGFFTPRVNRFIAGGSAIIIGAANITAPINLRDMIPDFITNPIIGGLSILGLAAYGALVGGVLVLMKRTE